MKKVLLFGLGFGVLGFGIFQYFKSQAALLSKFEYKVAGVKFNTITAGKVDVTLDIEFSSIADLEAEISKLYLDVFINNVKVGYITNSNNFIIPARGRSMIKLNLTFDPKLVFGNLIDMLVGDVNPTMVSVKIDGYASIRSGFIKATLPVRYTTTLKDYVSAKTK